MEDLGENDPMIGLLRDYSGESGPSLHETASSRSNQDDARVPHPANGPVPSSGAISHTRHQARASLSVLPEKSCSSGEWSVTTQLA
jgi:hypothetical protein